MSSDIITAENLSKHYLMFARPEDRLKQMIVPRLTGLLGRRRADYFTVFEANRNVSLRVGRGETVGIIGRNGSGKSTLLQMICGTLQPTSGTLSVTGRIAALLELGAGFNPDFTGRENVYMNGAIIGLSQAEIDAKLPAILDFADIGDFIDQPTKTYSSGMYVRLAFAVAINADPDILVVDEALSVGDEAFQRKCFARIEDLQSRGATILFVSHNAASITKLCDRAVLMDGGEAILQGAPKQVVAQYQRLINLTGEAAAPVRAAIKAMADTEITVDADTTDAPAEAGVETITNTEDPSWFDPGLTSQSEVEYNVKGARITDPELHNGAGQLVNHIAVGRRYRLSYTVECHEPMSGLYLGALFKMINGTMLGGANNTRPDPSATLNARTMDIKAGDRVHAQFDFTCNLRPDTYFITVGVMRSDGSEFLHRRQDALAVKVMDGTDISVFDAGYVALDSRMTVSKIEP